MFKLYRMQELVCLNETFEQKDLPLAVKTEFNATSLSWINLEPLVSKQVIYRLYDELPILQLLEQDSGQVLVYSQIPEDDWLINYLLSFGARLQVIKPVHLREKLRLEVEKIHHYFKT